MKKMMTFILLAIFTSSAFGLTVTSNTKQDPKVFRGQLVMSKTVEVNGVRKRVASLFKTYNGRKYLKLKIVENELSIYASTHSKLHSIELNDTEKEKLLEAARKNCFTVLEYSRDFSDVFIDLECDLLD